jgi:hypothetical protein
LKTSVYIYREAQGLHFQTLEGKITVGRVRHGLEDNVIIDLIETDWGYGLDLSVYKFSY